jgi:hypothetical protein
MKRWSIIFIIVILFVFSCSSDKNLTVRIENLDTALLKSVVVYVGNDSYRLENLESQESKDISFVLRAESNLDIEFETARGTKRRLRADCCIDSQDRWFALMRMKNDEVAHYEKDRQTCALCF